MSTAEVPSVVGWVRVFLPRLISVAVDGGDPDEFPDGTPVEGAITLTPKLAANTVVLLSDGTGMFPQPKKFPLVDGQFSGWIIDPTDADINPRDWEYGVALSVTGPGAPVTVGGTLVVPPVGERPVEGLSLLPLLPVSSVVGGVVTLTPGPQGEPGEGVPAGGSTGQVLGKLSPADYDSGWVDPGAASVPDATATTKGKLQLAGDLAGTADAPTVPGLAEKSDTGHTHPAVDVSDSTATGRAVLTAADAATARGAIGAGTSSLALGTTAGTAKAGDYAPGWTDVTGKPATFPPAAHGHVPDDLGSGTPAAGQYLDGDGTWKALPAGGGGGGATPLAMARQDKLYPLTAYDSSNGTALVGDIINLSTANLPAGATVKRILVAVKTAASAATNVEIGLYSPAGDLLASGVVDVSTTGNKEVNFASAVTLPPGLVLCAAKLVSASANGVVLHRDSTAADPYRSTGNPWDPMGGPARGLSVAHAGTGALPASIAGLTLVEGGVSYAFAYRVA